jgi:hypothetical protein
MNPKLFTLALVASLFAAALLLLSGCTYAGAHGTISFNPPPELLERAGIKLHPVNRDKK